MIDILMYVYENYMENVPRPKIDGDKLFFELRSHGYPDTDIKEAIRWLNNLSHSKKHLPIVIREHKTNRTFAPWERQHLNAECRGLINFLEQADILDGQTRELVIDQALALSQDEIDVDRLKWIILMVLMSFPDKSKSNFMREFVLLHDKKRLH
ncbi:MAG: DUF494 domain-containing protein [Gammaproteobacteria bacterium]